MPFGGLVVNRVQPLDGADAARADDDDALEAAVGRGSRRRSGGPTPRRRALAERDAAAIERLRAETGDDGPGARPAARRATCTTSTGSSRSTRTCSTDHSTSPTFLPIIGGPWPSLPCRRSAPRRWPSPPTRRRFRPCRRSRTAPAPVVSRAPAHTVTAAIDRAERLGAISGGPGRRLPARVARRRPRGEAHRRPARCGRPPGRARARSASRARAPCARAACAAALAGVHASARGRPVGARAPGARRPREARRATAPSTPTGRRSGCRSTRSGRSASSTRSRRPAPTSGTGAAGAAAGGP